jgi:hypothetical protein
LKRQAVHLTLTENNKEQIDLNDEEMAQFISTLVGVSRGSRFVQVADEFYNVDHIIKFKIIE